MSLDDELAQHFAGVATTELIRRINNAPDFGYDDLEYELNRRLSPQGLTWKWGKSGGRDVVEVFDPATGQPASFT